MLFVKESAATGHMLIDAELNFTLKPVWTHFGFMFKLYPCWPKNLKPVKKCRLCLNKKKIS